MCPSSLILDSPLTRLLSPQARKPYPSPFRPHRLDFFHRRLQLSCRTSLPRPRPHARLDSRSGSPTRDSCTPSWLASISWTLGGSDHEHY